MKLRMIRRGKFLILISLVCFASGLLAQPSPLWGDLEPGPYAIGFKTIEKYDHSRTFQPKYDYFGEPLSEETARPVQMCIWYPAQAADDAGTMVLGEYVFPNPEDFEFFGFVSGLQQRELALMGEILGGGGAIMDIMNVPVAAARNASVADGRFPPLVYFPGNGHTICDNLVMSEYLASHGYVVISVSFLGVSSYLVDNLSADLESRIADMQFALGNLEGEEYIDHSKLGAFGLGFGGAAALLLQMRDYRVDAVVEFFGADYIAEQANIVADNPFFDSRRMLVPALRIYSPGAMQYDFGLVDSCRFSPRHNIEIDSIPNYGLTSYQAIMDVITEDGIFQDSVSHPHYDAAAEYTRMFFDAFLKNDTLQNAALAGGAYGENIETVEISQKFMEADELPPTAAQFVDIISSRGPETAVEIYDKFNKADPGCIMVPEANMNMIGYRFLQGGEPEAAVEMFRINAEAYPNSANVWDSYSDGLQAVGNNEKALECYRKVLEKLPNDEQVGDQLREILRTNAEEGIERLQNENSGN